ncbi:MAG: rhodanese-like domain-containing protein [Gemmataceae bacterium]
MRSLIATLLFTTAAVAADHTTDTPDQVKKALADKTAVLIDVREPKEWDAGHLKDAKPLPLSKIRAGVPEAERLKVMPKGKVVYLHCKAGGRCLTAADELKKFGYDVRPLKAGYEDLLKAGLPKAEK